MFDREEKENDSETSVSINSKNTDNRPIKKRKLNSRDAPVVSKTHFIAKTDIKIIRPLSNGELAVVYEDSNAIDFWRLTNEGYQIVGGLKTESPVLSLEILPNDNFVVGHERSVDIWSLSPNKIGKISTTHPNNTLVLASKGTVFSTDGNSFSILNTEDFSIIATAEMNDDFSIVAADFKKDLRRKLGDEEKSIQTMALPKDIVDSSGVLQGGLIYRIDKKTNTYEIIVMLCLGLNSNTGCSNGIKLTDNTIVAGFGGEIHRIELRERQFLDFFLNTSSGNRLLQKDLLYRGYAHPLLAFPDKEHLLVGVWDNHFRNIELQLLSMNTKKTICVGRVNKSSIFAILNNGDVVLVEDKRKVVIMEFSCIKKCFNAAEVITTKMVAHTTRLPFTLAEIISEYDHPLARLGFFKPIEIKMLAELVDEKNDKMLNQMLQIDRPPSLNI